MPAQKASIAVPLRARAILGRATLILVPSKATIRVRTQRAAKARTSRVVGFQASASSSLVSDMEMFSEEGSADCSGCTREVGWGREVDSHFVNDEA